MALGTESREPGIFTTERAKTAKGQIASENQRDSAVHKIEDSSSQSCFGGQRIIGVSLRSLRPLRKLAYGLGAVGSWVQALEFLASPNDAGVARALR